MAAVGFQRPATPLPQRHVAAQLMNLRLQLLALSAQLLDGFAHPWSPSIRFQLSRSVTWVLSQASTAARFLPPACNACLTMLGVVRYFAASSAMSRFFSLRVLRRALASWVIATRSDNGAAVCWRRAGTPHRK